MKTKIIWIPAMLMILGMLVLHCGEDKAGLGDFCEKDSDCKSGLICRDNICQEPQSGDCRPPCEPHETCVNGVCESIDPGSDKDGDGIDSANDCDDLDPLTHPADPEKGIDPGYEYCDGKDNDCDGLIDEDCIPCSDGAVQDCGTDVGDCTVGTQTCTNGAWEACSGVAPLSETCDGKDNDCDGLIDEICPCTAGEQFPCSLNEGACVEGVQSCNNEGEWTECSGELPKRELCDNLDNDCDGLTDEAFNLGHTCEGIGQCGEGVLECVGGAPLDTQCDTMPGASNDASSDEVCDGEDNNCNEVIDEGLEIDSAPDACGVAEDLGVLPDDGSGITVPGNLWMQDDVDWYKIAATDSLQEDTEDGCDGFHFKVEITGNPTGNLLLDVYVDGCADANVDCKDDVIYEHNYNFSEEQQGQPVGQCPCSTTPQEGMTVCSADDKTFYIRVHGPADAKSCEPYELTITNGTPP